MADTQQTVLSVSGMDCADEVTAIQRALQPVADVREGRVNLMAGKVTITHGPRIDANGLIEAIKTRACSWPAKGPPLPPSSRT
ncbi:MAG: heavy-metal-associated domain-containing protein [Verrucomicrobia bacterium]|nr:heavy-metal-associated domain-containing protein [Verrucomicrobiota bacterium]